jgi:aspartate aminotransferase
VPSLSKRVLSIEESSSIKLATKIINLRNKGKDIIGLNVGEPDFSPQESVLSATKAAIDNGKYRYSKVQGEAKLVNNLLNYHQQLSSHDLSADNFLVSNGSKQSLYQIFQTICEPEDEVIIFSPYWVTFPEAIKLSGATPVSIAPDKVSLLPTIKQVTQHLTKKTKAIVINSPNNPSGRIFSEDLLKDLINLAKKEDLYIISDEAYIDLTYNSESPKHLFDIVEDSFDNIITARTFSKTHALTGFRIGYTIANRNLTKAMNNLQGHLTGNNCTFAQYGAVASLNVQKEVLLEQKNLFKIRRDKAFEIISPTLPLEKPEGAFYLFPSIEHVLKPGESCLDFCAELLEQKQVAILPGVAFGMKNYIRIAFTDSTERVLEGCQRIIDFIKER